LRAAAGAPSSLDLLFGRQQIEFGGRSFNVIEIELDDSTQPRRTIQLLKVEQLGATAIFVRNREDDECAEIISYCDDIANREVGAPDANIPRTRQHRLQSRVVQRSEVDPAGATVRIEELVGILESLEEGASRELQ
jgi:hypothetical protein